MLAENTLKDLIFSSPTLAPGRLPAKPELQKIGPPPHANGDGYGVQRKWANRFEGADRFLYGTLGLALVAPGYSVRDLNDSIDGQILSGERLVPKRGPKR
jgi:hypothetical protein